MFRLRFIVLSFLIVCTSLLVLSCGGSSVSPIIPGQDTSINIAAEPGPAMPAGRSLWGYYLVAVHPDNSEPVTLIPLRDSAFHVNIRGFLENMPCDHCLSIDNFAKTIDGFKMDISITHPFENAPWLYGFDVRGIIFFDGSIEFPELGVTSSSQLVGNAVVSNADGYTTLFNPTEYTGGELLGYTRGTMVPALMPDPSATLGGFKAFYSDGQSEDMGGRRAFSPGDTVTRTYEIIGPVESNMVFGYAIDASWEPPLADPPASVDDFPISANCAEPFRVDVEETHNLLTPDSGSVTLEITAWDHQGSDGIQSCLVEAPGLVDGVISADGPVVLDEQTAVFTVNIPCETGSASPTGEEVLVEILHDTPDPNLGLIPAYGYAIVDVENVPSTPTINYIEPSYGYQFEVVQIMIHGQGFHEGMQVELYKSLAVLPGYDVNVIDHQTAIATFSLDSVIGIYTVYVENPNGNWDEQHDAFEIIPN